MNIRFVTAAVILLAVYFAFGDFFHASALTTPESFVASIGRGIGGAITGVASSVGSFLGG